MLCPPGRLNEARTVVDRLRLITPLVVPEVTNYRDPTHSELFLSGLLFWPLVSRHERKPDRTFAHIGGKLIAVVYADMVGYSRLIGLDDAGTLERLRYFREVAIATRNRASTV